MEICNADEAKFAPWQLAVARCALDILQAHEGNIPAQGLHFPDVFN